MLLQTILLLNWGMLNGGNERQGILEIMPLAGHFWWQRFGTDAHGVRNLEAADQKVSISPSVEIFRSSAGCQFLLTDM